MNWSIDVSSPYEKYYNAKEKLIERKCSLTPEVESDADRSKMKLL